MGGGKTGVFTIVDTLGITCKGWPPGAGLWAVDASGAQHLVGKRWGQGQGCGPWGFENE